MHPLCKAIMSGYLFGYNPDGVSARLIMVAGKGFEPMTSGL